MHLLDVNVLIPGFDRGHEHHVRAWSALNEVFDSGEQVGLSSVAVSGMLRVLAGGLFRERLSLLVHAADFVDTLRASTQTVSLEPGSQHWPLFRQFVRTGRIGRAAMTDAWFAALAIEHSATLVTFDGGFAQFEPFGLKWRHLAA